MISWLKSLFERKCVRKRRKILDKEDVIRCEEFIKDGYSKDVLLDYFDISEYTYYKIKNGKHRYST